LVRALAVDAEVPQPPPHASGLPTVPVPGDDELMPAPPAGVAAHGGAELRLRCLPYGLAVLLGGRRVAERLGWGIASIAPQIGEQDDARVGPAHRALGLRELSRESKSIAR